MLDEFLNKTDAEVVDLTEDEPRFKEVSKEEILNIPAEDSKKEEKEESKKDFICEDRDDINLEMLENYLTYCNNFHIINYIKQVHLGTSQIPLPCEVTYPKKDEDKEILKSRANTNRQLRELTSSCFTWPDCTTCDKHDECYKNADEYRILSVDLPNNTYLGKTH